MADRKRPEGEPLQEEQDEALAEVDRLADQIARAWRSPKGVVEILEEQRRERDLVLRGGNPFPRR